MESKRLASKHNRAAVFCHEVTTWDKISKLVYVKEVFIPKGMYVCNTVVRFGSGTTNK